MICGQSMQSTSYNIWLWCGMCLWVDSEHWLLWRSYKEYTPNEKLDYGTMAPMKQYFEWERVFFELIWIKIFWVWKEMLHLNWTVPNDIMNCIFPMDKKKKKKYQSCKTLKTASAIRRSFQWINPEYLKSNTVPCSSSPEYFTKLLASALERHQGVLILVL